MNICIIGDGLTALSLAKNLINKKINVHMYYEHKIKNLSSSRTIGISKSNFNFFKKEIYNISKKNFWEINRIEIYSEKSKNQKLLEFENNQQNLFYLVKNYELCKSLKKEISKNNYYKAKLIKKNFYEDLLRKNKYNLIINCLSNNYLSKKYFTKKINKNYNNLAYTTILEHKKVKNNTAVQTFTRFGPIAFLPMSKTKTSVVCSLDTKKKIFNNKDVVNLINQNNPKYEIKKIYNLSSFELSLSNLRYYHYKNILAFGDLLHKIHPLAGQGFNMSIRDIKILSNIIQSKIDLGLQLDSLILNEFEKKTKNKNFLFSRSIDFIHEIFTFDKDINNKNFNNFLKVIGKNKNLTNYFIKLADKGLNL